MKLKNEWNSWLMLLLRVSNIYIRYGMQFGFDSCLLSRV